MSRLGQCFGFRLQALVLGLDVFLVVGFCGLSTGFWSGIRMGSRVWPGAGLGWVGLVALLGVIMDRSPSGWSVSATRSCRARSVGGFSNPWTVWIRVSFRFDKMCKFRVL